MLKIIKDKSELRGVLFQIHLLSILLVLGMAAADGDHGAHGGHGGHGGGRRGRNGGGRRGHRHSTRVRGARFRVSRTAAISRY